MSARQDDMGRDPTPPPADEPATGPLPPTATSVERQRVSLEAQTGRSTDQFREDMIALVLSATGGALLGAVLGALWVVLIGGRTAMVVSVAALIGVFVGVALGLGVFRARSREARREFAELRRQARREAPVRYRRGLRPRSSRQAG